MVLKLEHHHFLSHEEVGNNQGKVTITTEVVGGKIAEALSEHTILVEDEQRYLTGPRRMALMRTTQIITTTTYQILEERNGNPVPLLGNQDDGGERGQELEETGTISEEERGEEV